MLYVGDDVVGLHRRTVLLRHGCEVSGADGKRRIHGTQPLGIRKSVVLVELRPSVMAGFGGAGAVYYRTVNHSRIEVSRMARGLLRELHSRGKAKLRVYVGEMGLHGARGDEQP